MYRLAPIMATAVLLLSADVSGVMHMRPPSEPVKFPPNESLPALPEIPQANDQNPVKPTATQATTGQPARAGGARLQPQSRLALIRFVDGEFVRVITPIPAGKKGLHLKAGAPPDDKSMRISIHYAGAAINPGDRAQITSMEFKERQIIVGINGGGRGNTRLRDRIHMEIGGVPTMTTTGAESRLNTSAGASVYLDFDKPLPDMTPDELKHYLSSVLDFSKQHSAAVQWIETLPPEIQSAIADKRPAVGMDHEMVLAALGRPDRKVREKEPDGTESEDWIYGKPPAKTVFVKFEGDKVTQVQQFPR
jgi:hypothetical protein